jgi:hypothetical protein
MVRFGCFGGSSSDDGSDDDGFDPAPPPLPATSSFPETHPLHSSAERMRETWLALGDNKWREVIDGRHAYLGPLVYDACLHGQNFGQPEIGFLDSMKRGWEYLAGRLGEPTTLDMWLAVHGLVMAHTHDKDAVGTLRPKTRKNFVQVPARWPGKPNGLPEDARREIEAMRPLLCRLDPPSSKEMGAYDLVFLPMSRGKRAKVFDLYVRRFYARVLAAGDDKMEVVRACAALQQAMQRMEPSIDGNQRTACLFLNKHLTEFGLHPTILYWPNGADLYTAEEWAMNVVLGLKEWRRVREGQTPSLDGCWDDPTGKTRAKYEDDEM